MMNVNPMDLVANGFIRDFQAARRNLPANGNPNVGESTGNLGASVRRARFPTSVFADIQNNNVGLARRRARSPHAGHRPRGGGAAGQLLPAEPAVQHRGRRLHLFELGVQRPADPAAAPLRRRPCLLVNYTLAKSNDDVSNDTRGAGTELVVPTDPIRLELDEGRSDFDVRHVVPRPLHLGSSVWQRPRASMRDATGLVNALISGWQVNGILDASSGIPVQRVLGLPHVHVLRLRHARRDRRARTA